MIHYLKVGLRNLWRNKRRSLLTIAAIIVAQLAIVNFRGYVEYTYWGMREGIINGETGHIQIYKKGFNLEGQIDPFSYMIEDIDSVKNEIGDLEHIKAITSRIELNGIVAKDDKSKIFTGLGVNPEQEKEISTFIDIIDGYNLSDDHPDGALIGIGLRKVLDAQVGDYLTLLAPTKYGGLNAIDIKVRGVIQTGTKAVDNMLIKIPIEQVKLLLGSYDVTKMIILLDDTKNTSIVEKQIQRIIEQKELNLEIRTWKDLADVYWGVVKIYDNIFFFINIVIVLIVIFSIVNTLTMTVMERVSEIGTIRAMGMKRLGIMKLFLSEGFLLGIVGSIIGVLIALMVAGIININGIETAPPPGQNRGYTNFILITPVTIAFSFCLTTVVALIASIFPAWKAGKMQVVDALRYNN